MIFSILITSMLDIILILWEEILSWSLMGGKGLIDIFLYSYHLPACYCINIAKRNSVLVTQGVKELITGSDHDHGWRF